VKLGDEEAVKDLPQVLRAVTWTMRLGSRWKELKRVGASQGG
jgi:hypothetical protein